MQNPPMTSHLDPQLEDRILHEVKSQGVFDEFRKNSIADVDTKPAYQNLRQRVENTVKKFLSEQQWTPDMNKNQLREKLRKHITEAGFLDVGVERIVDQVVNPKISTFFQPRIEEITYKYLGLPPPPIKHEPPPPPIMHPLPPLPLTGPPLKVDTSNLLPTGLEQVSPDSDKATVKSECRDDDRSIQDMDIDTDEKMVDDDDESPPFEPLVRSAENNGTIKTEALKRSEEPVETKPVLTTPKKISNPADQTESVEVERQYNHMSANTYDYQTTKLPNIKLEVDTMLSQDSQLSQVSSDSRISDVTANASHSFMDPSSPENATKTISDPTEAALELASANISEEAQMPRFNENSSEIVGKKSISSELHFDIKKDEIKFQGTERKSNLLRSECNLDVGKNNSSDQIFTSRNTVIEESKHRFNNMAKETTSELTRTMCPTTPAVTPTPTSHESSFGSSLEDVSNHQYMEHCKNGTKNIYATEPNSVFSTPSDRKETNAVENRGSSSSSSRHKKHSKDRRRSHESKGKHRDRDRSKSKHKDKYKHSEKDRGKDRSREKSKHKDKERHRRKDSERRDKDRSRDKEKYRTNKHKSKHSSSERSSSKRHDSHTSRDRSKSKYEKGIISKHSASLASSTSSSSRSESHKARRVKRDKNDCDSNKHRSSSGNSITSKKVDIKREIAKLETLVDDHNVEKTKMSKRRSSDSNDEDKGSGANGGKSVNGRENEIIKFNGSTFDTQKEKQKESKNSSPNSQSSSGKSTSGFPESHYEEKLSYYNFNVNQKMCERTTTKEITTQNHPQNVVILNDLLENPNIKYVNLGPTKEACYLHNSDAASTSIADIKLSPEYVEANKNILSGIAEDQLLFFEDVNAQFTDRLRLLDNAMDRCRRVVNNLRFDCANDSCDGFEGVDDRRINELNLNISTKTTAQLRIACVPTFTVEDCSVRCNADSKVNSIKNTVNSAYGLTNKRKRDNNGQLIHSKPSPTLSEASSNSKENVAFDKNAEEVKCIRRLASVNKLSQQRYNSEDLYKPRPVLSQRSRRRGMETIN